MVYETKTQSEIINDMLINIVSNVDEINDINVGSILRQITESLGIEVSNLYAQLDEVYNSSRIETATGADLESIGKLVSVERDIGSKATGYVTFKRNQPAINDFTISANSSVSTQPNTSTEQLKFIVKENTTFSKEINSEKHTFISGVYDYKLDERFVYNITGFSAMVGGSSTTFTKDSDYTLEYKEKYYIIDPDKINVIDDCENPNYSYSADAIAPTLDNSDFKQGNNSINIGKTGTTSDYVKYFKTISATSISNKNIYLWLKINDLTNINKIELMLGTNSESNVYIFELNDLSTGWKQYRLDLNSKIKSGEPNLNNINFLQLKVTTNNASDTITLGDIKFDYIIMANDTYYYGDVIHFITIPDDESEYSVSYIPLSKEVEVEGEDVGVKYNVGINRIIYKSSNIPNIDNVNNYMIFSGGIDEESDSSLREKIQNAVIVSGKATADAIKQSVLNITGIISVKIYDTPLKTSTSEAHIYNATTKKFKLNYESVINDDNIVISDTEGGSADYTKGVDYVVNEITNEIDFSIGSNTPDDGATVYVDYTYNWVGHVDLIVAGASIPISEDLMNEVEDVVGNTASAGIIVNISEPSIVQIDVTGDIDIKSGYYADTVKENVKQSISEYLNSAEIGEDIYVSKIISVIMGVDGVQNITLSEPISDISISEIEIAKAGTITIN